MPQVEFEEENFRPNGGRPRGNYYQPGKQESGMVAWLSRMGVPQAYGNYVLIGFVIFALIVIVSISGSGGHSSAPALSPAQIRAIPQYPPPSALR